MDTFADLRTVLQTANSYTTVYLAADIAMTAGIAILASKTKLTIDGLYPPGSGVIHTLTEYSSSDLNDTLGIRSASSISMTVRNLTIIGRNYYGILFVPDGAAYAGVTATYENVTYTGPQITYNPNGLTRYINCDITISAGYSPTNEVGEVNRVEIGGTTSIRQTSTAYPLFYFRGSSPSLTILSGAKASLQGNYDGMLSASALRLALASNASLHVALRASFCRNSSYRLSSVTVGANAVLHLVQNAASAYSVLYLNGAFVVEEGADVYIQSPSTIPPATFYSAECSLMLCNPRRFALYSGGSAAFLFRYAITFSIVAQQLNIWSAATALSKAGGFDDQPRNSWRKTAPQLLQLSGSSSASGTTISSHNLTKEELNTLPPFNSLQLGTARVFSAGNLPLQVDTITADSAPFNGSTAPGGILAVSYFTNGATHNLLANAGQAGKFSIIPSPPIPLDAPVTVTANIPFLLTTVSRRAVAPGTLTLAAPEMLAFVFNVVAQSPTLYAREKSGWTVTVSDTRVRGGSWYLYASVNAPLTGKDPAHTLPGYLVFVTQSGQILPLSNTPLLVHSATTSRTAPSNTAVHWPATQGFLLRAGELPFYKGERYTANITWHLSDAPLDEA